MTNKEKAIIRINSRIHHFCQNEFYDREELNILVRYLTWLEKQDEISEGMLEMLMDVGIDIKLPLRKHEQESFHNCFNPIFENQL